MPARREECYRTIPGAVAVFAVLAASFALAALDETEPFHVEVEWPLLVLGTLDAQSVPPTSAVAGWPNPAFAASGVEIAPVATVRNGDGFELAGPWGIAVYESDSRLYAIVVERIGDAVQIIDITDPASPAAVATVRNGDGFELAGPTGIAVYESGGISYAAVSAFQGNTVQIVRIDARILPTVGANLEPDGKEGSGTAGSTPQDSPAAEPPNAGGCLIATAAYGTETAPQVQALREVRDNVVLETAAGSAFMQGFNQVYYSFSPAIADMQRQNDAFNTIVRALVMPMLATLSIMSLADGSSEIGVVGLGLSVLVLNMGLYVGSPTFAGFLIHRYRKHRSDAHPDNQKCTN